MTNALMNLNITLRISSVGKGKVEMENIEKGTKYGGETQQCQRSDIGFSGRRKEIGGEKNIQRNNDDKLLELRKNKDFRLKGLIENRGRKVRKT